MRWGGGGGRDATMGPRASDMKDIDAMKEEDLSVVVVARTRGDCMIADGTENREDNALVSTEDGTEDNDQERKYAEVASPDSLRRRR